ncbi:MAG: hypothetical protein FWD89_03090 [Firmicutes bacterium]|nr:hypothetical protein [Bacillota bacterium]MCL2771275.1 hypothetical protein [Bacillota bacterium]
MKPERTNILRFVDIDETVFHTTAKVMIRDKKTGKLLRELTNQEWNTYVVKPDEKPDFVEFADAVKFASESTPIEMMVALLRQWSRQMKLEPVHYDDKVVFVTARGDFDDREKFLDAFRKIGIAIDDKKYFYVARTGNLSPDAKMNGLPLSTAQRKKIVYLHYIMAKMPAVVEIYEDSEKNINDFMELVEEMPDFEYRAFLVRDGGITQVTKK